MEQGPDFWCWCDICTGLSGEPLVCICTGGSTDILHMLTSKLHENTYCVILTCALTVDGLQAIHAVFHSGTLKCLPECGMMFL